MNSPAKTLLLVDDEIIIAADQEHQLKKEGYRVLLAASGKEAIEVIRSGKQAIDLILMDIDLGKGMDGTEAAQQILKIRDLPIVFHSMHTEREIVEKTEKITSYGYVVKNSGITVLSASIKMAFKLHEAHRELVKKEEELRESESKFRLVFNQSPMGAAISSPDYRFISVNEEMCRMLGYSENKLKSLTFKDITHPDYLGTDVEQVRRLKVGEIDHYSTDKKYVRKDGTVFWGHLSLRAIRDNTGELLYFLPMLLDISDRKRAETEIKEIETKTRNIISNLPLGIHQYRLEPDGGLIFEGANPAADRILRVDNSNFIGMSIGEAFPGLIETEVPLRYRQACEEGIPWDADQVSYEDKKIKGAFEVHAFQTEPGRMAAVFSDITARKKEEERIRILSELIESSPASITVHDFEGNFLYVNQSTFKMHGYTEKEFFSLNLKDLDVPESSKLIESRMARILEFGEASFEVGHFRKDGSIIPLNIHAKVTQWEGKKVLLSIAMDLTQRKRAEEALKEEEELFGIFLRKSPVYVFFKDERLRAVRLSDNYEQLLGRPMPYLIGKTMYELFPGEVAGKMVEDDRKVLLEGKQIDVIEELDGRTFFTTKFPIPRPGKPSFLAGFTIDITEQRAAEKAMRESEEKYRRLFENASIGVFHTMLEGRILTVNPSLARMFGYDSPAEMANAITDISRQLYVDPKDRAEVVAAVLKTDGWVHTQNNFRRKDGSLMTGNLSLHKELNPDGSVAYLEGFMEDITERRRAEKLIHLADERLRFLLFSTSVVIYSAEASPDYHATFVSRNAVRITGYESERFLNEPNIWIDNIHPEDRERILNELPAILERGAYTYEYRFKCKDGRYIWMRDEMSLVKDADGRPLEIIGYWIDITEQIQAREALAESEARYRRISDAITDYIYTVGVENGKAVETRHGPGCLAVTGYAEEEFAADRFLWFRMVATEDRGAVEDHARRVLAGSETAALEHRIIRKDGARRWVRNTPVPHYDNQGKLLLYDGLIQDITDRKRAEEALRESEGQFRTLAEQSPNMIFINQRGRVLYANKKCEEIMGYTREEFYSANFDFIGITAPEYVDLVKAMFARHMRGEDVEPYEYALLTKQGNRIETIIATKLIDYRDERAILGIITDITDRKNVEAALFESEERFRTIFEHAGIGMAVINESAEILNLNPALERFLGYSREELNKLEMKGATHPDDLNKDMALFNELISGSRTSYDIDKRYIRRDGSEVWGHLIMSLIKGSEKGSSYAIGMVENINERKRAEEAQQRSDVLFRAMVESSPLSIIVSVGPDGIFEYINPKFTELFGYTADDIRIARDWWKLAYPDKDYRKQVVSEWLRLKQVSASKPGIDPYEVEVTCKDGSKKIIEFKMACIGEKYITFGIDLTQRKQAEKDLAKLVSEKELWLKELQHRVKNNLNVISSLLGLEMERLKDERARQIFTNAQLRIRSMSAIYEQLYHSTELDSVSLSQYIKELAESLYASYSLNGRHVQLKTNIEQIKLDLKRAVPLGLIVNELIVNALKYAYPDNKKGDIRIDLRMDEGMVQLRVSDDGVGFPEGVDPIKTESMGLSLVGMLARQIGGELSFKKGKGVKASVMFRL